MSTYSDFWQDKVDKTAAVLALPENADLKEAFLTMQGKRFGSQSPFNDEQNIRWENIIAEFSRLFSGVGYGGFCHSVLNKLQQ